MLDLEQRHLDIVMKILQEHIPECEVRVFGSRVTGKAKKYSDLDLIIKGSEAINWRKLEALKDAFSASDLPISVDVVDWETLSPEFINAVLVQSKLLQQPKNQP